MRTSVAVIGAGAVGLAVALQMRRAGVHDVLLLDRHASPGQGSTSRANGGFRAQFATPINIAFSMFTIRELKELDQLTNGLAGIKQVGYLFMVGTSVGAEALRRAFELQRSCGVPVEWLSPEDVVRRAPFVRPDDLVAGTFCPADGILDPGGVAAALWAEARRLGVRSAFGRKVTAIEDRGGSFVLQAGAERVEAEWVVNAAGPEAAGVAAMAGIELPVLPFRRNLACTEPVQEHPGPIPMCVDLDTHVLIRREGSGFLLAYSDPADSWSFDTTFDPGFLEALATRVGHRFPFLETVPIDERKCWAGLYPETSDHHAIVDEAPQHPRFLQCAGFGGHGIMHSLAAGRAVAELVTQGRCTTFDLRPLRLSRFEEGDSVIESVVL